MTPIAVLDPLTFELVDRRLVTVDLLERFSELTPEELRARQSPDNKV
jgi:hypothetical protein